jgi:hypothetical protein
MIEFLPLADQIRYLKESKAVFRGFRQTLAWLEHLPTKQ